MSEIETAQEMFVLDKEVLYKKKQKAERALREVIIAQTAKQMLKDIESEIKVAGGAVSEEDLAKSSLKDLLLMAARNKLTIKIGYTGPASDELF